MNTQSATKARKALLEQFTVLGKGSQDAVFQTARQMAQTFGGRALSDKPAAIDGWQVDFLYFADEAEGEKDDFVYVMWRGKEDGEADLGIAQDSDPNTPPWLKKTARSMLSARQAATKQTK
ncbi:hypothetical protein ACFL12_00820 [Pseudomonadota bacterium]